MNSEGEFCARLDWAENALIAGAAFHKEQISQLAGLLRGAKRLLRQPRSV
jgi:hypothetical protein